MSLFSRLEERMRARDSQDNSKEKDNQKTAPEETGGLFGSIRLEPPSGSVPPPPAAETGAIETPVIETPAAADETAAPEISAPEISLPKISARPVPSIEEARAEFDRARAELTSGMFRRKSEMKSETSDETPRENPARAIPPRESASFGAVSLPPFAPDDALRDASDTESELSSDATSIEANQNEKTESSSIFTSQPADVAASAGSEANPEAEVVYAPTPIAEREQSDGQIVAAQDVAPATGNLLTSDISPVADAPEVAVQVPESQALGSSSAPKSEERPAPIARAGNASNLTPFQRLMAARAAQGGTPVSRPRTERSVPEAPIAEVPAIETPSVETSDAIESSVSDPIVEEPQLESPQVEVNEKTQSPTVETPQDEVPIEVTTSQNLDATAGADEEPSSVIPAVAPEIPEAETPESGEKVEPNTDEVTPEVISIEAPNAETEPRLSETEPEAEIEPEAETESEAVASEEDSVPVALSLAERLARAPRAELEAAHAELEAAHAEAEALVPEVLTETAALKVEETEPSRLAMPASFADRLAARKRLEEASADAPAQPAADDSAAPPPAAPADGAPAAIDAETPAMTAVEAPIATDVETPDVEAPTIPVNSAPPTPVSPTPASPAPRDEPRRASPRSFSERLAARTSLDRNLQMPTEETPAPQSLATANAELARIDSGAQLSEREMKNSVLFRQKNLIFDTVIGSIDQRALQNPTRESVKPLIERSVDAALQEFNLTLESFERNWMVDEFVRETTDLGALVPLLEDPSISKIVVTGANDVSVERLGRIERTGIAFRDDDHLLSLVRRIAELSGGRVDAKVPLLDRPLPDGGRIRAKVPPLAPQPTLTIEKSTGNPFVALKRQIEEKSRSEALPYAQLRERIQQRLLREFEGDAAALAGDQDKLRGQVEEMISSVISEERVAVTRAERASLVMDLLHEIVGLGPIEPLLNDPDIDEVMVNGPYQIYVERKGKLELTSQRFRDNAHVMQVIDRIVAPLGRRVDEKSPMVDGRLRDGSRFNAIIPPLALGGPTMTIRKFARDPFTMSDLINFGSITREAAQFLQAAVEGRLNIVVSGGTGSGKTTTLNVLSSFIPSTERIVTIEDAAELQMRQEHVIRMETRPPNIEGVGEVGIRDLVRNSLRMRPDRIVVGECRGGEALDMLQAMNTGHDGSLTTAHSNGPRDTCKRLETMVMMAGFDLPVRAIREQISMAVQLIVHQERMRDGKRRVTAVTEIVGMEGDVLTLQDIFRFEQEGIDDDGRIIGALQATGMRPKYYETIVDNGVAISMELFQPKSHESAPRGRLSTGGAR